MSNVLEFEDYGDAAIKMIRSEEFFTAADEISAFINGLPISATQANKLVDLAVRQVNIAEKDAFLQGADIGIKIEREFGNE